MLLSFVPRISSFTTTRSFIQHTSIRTIITQSMATATTTTTTTNNNNNNKKEKALVVDPFCYRQFAEHEASKKYGGAVLYVLLLLLLLLTSYGWFMENLFFFLFIKTFALAFGLTHCTLVKHSHLKILAHTTYYTHYDSIYFHTKKQKFQFDCRVWRHCKYAIRCIETSTWLCTLL